MRKQPSGDQVPWKSRSRPFTMYLTCVLSALHKLALPSSPRAASTVVDARAASGRPHNQSRRGSPSLPFFLLPYRCSFTSMNPAPFCPDPSAPWRDLRVEVVGRPLALCLGCVMAVAVASDCLMPLSLVETVRGCSILCLAAVAIGR
jgi:hypothetical protein